MLDRYLLFCCEQFYPAGGWGDFEGGFTNIDQAVSRGEAVLLEWGREAEFQVVDLHTLSVVRRGVLSGTASSPKLVVQDAE